MGVGGVGVIANIFDDLVGNVVKEPANVWKGGSNVPFPPG